MHRSHVRNFQAITLERMQYATVENKLAGFGSTCAQNTVKAILW